MGQHDNVVAVILGGGAGSRLFPLTGERSKPAVPLGGTYRLIDVPVSNCINSEITQIFVLTQYNSASLNRHISRTYRFSNFSSGFVEVLAAEQTKDNPQWFQGTADAVRQMLPHLRDWEEIYLERARRIVEEDDPDIPGYDDALWPIERDYRGQDPREVFDDFSELRLEHVELLLALPPEAWDRTGEHSLYGKMSLGWMEDHVCDHDSEHLDQAREVLAG